MVENTLGDCKQCGQPLCVRPDRVACTMCGLPVPNHPLAAKVVEEQQQRPATLVVPARKKKGL